MIRLLVTVLSAPSTMLTLMLLRFALDEMRCCSVESGTITTSSVEPTPPLG